jgi:DNA-binding CsgD family transcriptional regulator
VDEPQVGGAERWPLVGRDEELAAVRGALADGARLVVLAGPAGVGKSRLAHEALAGLDIPVVRVLASRSAASIPLGALAPLLPALGERDARPRDLVLRAAEGLRSAQPGDQLLVVVDDAHALDDLSAQVLLEASHAPDIALVVTARDGEPLPPALVEAVSQLDATHIALAPLDRASTGALLERVLGGPADGAAQREIWERSRGNALYLRELVLGAVEHDILVQEGGLWRLAERLAPTPRLAELVEARLSDLSPAERHVMEVVAFGEPIPLTLVQSLGQADALATVEKRMLIIRDPDDEGDRPRLRLAHPLYGEILRASMPSIRALRLNRVLADAGVDALDPVDAADGVDALRLAVWRLDGGGEGDPKLLTRGAVQAHVAHDDVLAERLARAALRAGAGVDAGLLLAASLVEQGRHAEAHELFASLADRDLTDLERVVMAKRWAETLIWGLGRWDDAEEVLQTSMDAVADNPERRNELLARRVMFHQQAATRETFQDDLAPILTGAEGRAFCEAAVTAGFDLAAKGSTAAAEALCRRAFEVQFAMDDQFGLLHPGAHLSALALALTEAGRLDEAESVARDMGYDVALALHLSYGQAWMALMLGRVALDRGHPETACRWFQESALVFGEIGQTGPRYWALAGYALAISLVGDADEAERALAELDLAPSSMAVYRLEGERARAWVQARKGELTEARERLAKEAEWAEGVATALAARAWHDVARLGGGKEAADSLDRIALCTDGAFIPARALHARGLADNDPKALEEAGCRFAGMGANMLAAEAYRSAAEASRRTGLRAAATASERRADELLEACEASSTTPLRLTANAARLTRREQEVAGLAVEGKSNQEIADQLDVSIRTVENHLQRAYEKFGIAGRDALADAIAAG